MAIGILIFVYILIWYRRITISKIINTPSLEKVKCRLTYGSGFRSVRMMVPVAVWVTLGNGFFVVSPADISFGRLFYAFIFPMYFTCQQSKKSSLIQAKKPKSIQFLSPKVLQIHYSRLLGFRKGQIELRQQEGGVPFENLLDWCEG